MEQLTERQRKILELVVREYIKYALPVSSKIIEEKHALGVSPATIRSEMYELANKGYLSQPHTSAGRVPTDRGYRFFVDNLTEIEAKKIERKLEREIVSLKKELEKELRFTQEFTRLFAETVSGLTISYLPREKIVLKEGWAEALRDPEFEDIEKVHKFISLVHDFEENIDVFFAKKGAEAIHIYIGREFPLSGDYDFSVMISPCRISRRDGLLAVLGPKRMPYDRNIYLISAVMKLLK